MGQIVKTSERKSAEDGDLAFQRIAVVVVSPFSLAVKVGKAFASLVSNANAFSHWREVEIGAVGAMRRVVWWKVFVHGPKSAKPAVLAGCARFIR
jgi:hypothetical protein